MFLEMVSAGFTGVGLAPLCHLGASLFARHGCVVGIFVVELLASRVAQLTDSISASHIMIT